MLDEKLRDDIVHQWVYYIAPISRRANVEDLVFAAFCKGCRQYYTERMDIHFSGKAQFSESHLPKYGCQPSNL